ncbi:MAG TPA: ABC transporter ATP-binding protein [Blastocatellia bacterium]|nr:ABC transporter ATP-binding protein [Blastocatellia bacterium]
MSYLPKALHLVYTAAPHWMVAWAILLVLEGALPVLNVWLTRRLVDSLVAAIGRGAWEGAERVWPIIAIMAGVLILIEASNAAGKWVRSAQSGLVEDHILTLIHTQALALDLSFYDSPTYYDRLHQARVDVIHRPQALMENLGRLFQSGLTLMAITGLLCSFGWWLPLILFLSTLPALGIVGRFAWRQNQWRKRSLSLSRRADYYSHLLTDQQAAAELRLFNLGPFFHTAFQSLRMRLWNERIGMVREQARGELLAGGIGLIAAGTTMVWVLFEAVRGVVSLGQVAMFYQIFNQGQKLMRALLESIGQIYGNTLFLGNLFEFLALEPQISDPRQPKAAPPLTEAVRFEAVTFSYPGSERQALCGLDLTIKAGTIVAILGENGAGKSTLVKLLCRFYLPGQGRITLDGVDLRELAQTELWSRLTVLFQAPMHYPATVRENIALGDPAKKTSLEEILAAAQGAGAEILIEKLPDGYETLLGKKFGGSELSIGEWQRVALARALLKPAPLIILDEPTSAMDPWAEADWMIRFRSFAAGRTALIITHRLTTARQADMIHVMAEGKIVESGSHDELLALSGRYAQSWWQQRSEEDGTADWRPGDWSPSAERWFEKDAN